MNILAYFRLFILLIGVETLRVIWGFVWLESTGYALNAYEYKYNLKTISEKCCCALLHMTPKIVLYCRMIVCLFCEDSKLDFVSSTFYGLNVPDITLQIHFIGHFFLSRFSTCRWPLHLLFQRILWRTMQPFSHYKWTI